MLALAIAACIPIAAAADDASPAAPQTLTSVVLVAPKAKISAQVANTEAQRELGLMNSRSLPPHHGMIFVFEAPAVQTFWMKNTLIPLDMVFIARNGTVTTVAANVPATSATTPGEKTTRTGNGTYVLEINAGEASKDGITAGSHIQIPPLGAKP